MHIPTLFRIRAAPQEYLGTKSLILLEAFLNGYDMLDYARLRERTTCQPEFRAHVFRKYDLEFQSCTETAVLRAVSGSEAQAFDLFFRELDYVLATTPELPRQIPTDRTEKPNPPAVSVIVDRMSVRPIWVLPRLSPAGLRALLDGYVLALSEEGWFDSIDIDLCGFERWLLAKRKMKGLLRWERVLLIENLDSEERAFEAALRELRAYMSRPARTGENRADEPAKPDLTGE